MDEAPIDGQAVTDLASSTPTPVRVDRPPDHYLAGSTLGRSTLPRYVGGLLLILLAWAVGTIAVQAALLAAGRPHPTSPAGELAFLTSTFAVGCLAVPGVVRGLLRRPGWTVAMGRLPGPVCHLAIGAGISSAVGFAVDLLVPIAPLHRVPLDLSIWLPLVAVALGGFLVQAGFEELLFRGYLMQAVASRTRRAALVIGVPAALFAIPHWGNLPPYGNNPLQPVPYVLMGLLYGWAAWRTGSLWLPLGLHWANNTYATLVISGSGDVLPAAGPLARDLASVPLGMLIATTSVSCAIQVAIVRLTVPKVPAARGPEPRGPRPRGPVPRVVPVSTVPE